MRGLSLSSVSRVARDWAVKLALKLARSYGTRRDAAGLSHSAWREIGRRRYRRAVFLARGAVASDPSYGHGHRMLALAHARSGDYMRSRQAYEEAIRVAPEDAWVWSGLGDLERHVERYVEAESCYRRALELEERNPEALWALAEVLRIQGRLHESEALLGQALVLAPRNARVAAVMAAVRVQQRNYAEALRLLSEAVKREPADAYVRYCLALALDATENRQGALEEARKATELEPEDEAYRALYQRLLDNVRLADPGDGRG